MNARGARRVVQDLLGPVVALFLASPALAVEEGLRELQLPPELVEKEIKADADLELPPPTYPLTHVDQNAS